MAGQCDLGVCQVEVIQWLDCRVVQEWILFIKTKNVDPNAKHRFVQAIEYLKRELENVKRQLEEIKDGTLLAQKEE